MGIDPLVIDDIVIPAGTSKTVDIQVARLLSGTLIHMHVHVFRSENPGPTVLLSGGLHGDEVIGIEVVRRMISVGTLDNITCGTVVAIPIINVYGFLFFSREVTDGKDVNRSFPGSPNGSLAAQVAHTMATKILPVVDLGIDFHTGGASMTNYPQIRYDPLDPKAIDMAKAFQAPLSLGSGLISGSLRACAQAQNVPIIVFEGGESLRMDELAVEEAIRGTKRMLFSMGMLETAPKIHGIKARMKGEARLPRHIGGNVWVRADVSGLFSFERGSGQAVREGELIGRIRNPYDSYSVKVLSPMDGFIVGHNNIPLVHSGDALFHIGKEQDWPTVDDLG